MIVSLCMEQTPLSTNDQIFSPIVFPQEKLKFVNGKYYYHGKFGLGFGIWIR